MIYHIFSNNEDDYTTDYTVALWRFQEFCEAHGCARIYEKQDEDDDGDCIKSYGEYPQ